MKTKLLIFAILLGLLMACSKDDGPQIMDPDPKPKAEKSSAKQITGFALRTADNAALENDVIGTIDQQNRAITATVPAGTDVTALLPEMEVSAKASVTPEGMTNFKDSLNYTVTAEDGSTAMYRAAIHIAASGEKQILSFRFLGIVKDGVSVDVTAEIDQAKKTVTAILPSGTKVTALEPSIEISPEATLDPEGPQDFTGSVNYTVTAGNGTSATYALALTVALTEKQVLLLIAKENPGNTLVGWSKENSLEAFEGASTNSDGKVSRLEMNNKGLNVLPPEIGQLVNLEYMSLYSNELEDIPFEIWQLTNLSFLALSGNNIASVPPEIRQLVNLEYLSLGGNELEAMPHEIWQLTNLIGLSLEYIGLGVIPPEIRQLVNLESLSLVGNKLKTIPAEIGQLVNLKKLFSGGNELKTISPDIGKLINLTHLYLEYNELEAIPREIGQLGNLKTLFLTNNVLGAIPAEMGQLTGLENLRLAGNGLTKIPNEVCKLDTSSGGATRVDIVPGVLCEFVLGDPLSTIPVLGLDR